MTDLAAVVLALAAAAGALAARPVPLALAGAVGAAAFLLRRPLLLAAGVALAASGLAARAWAGLEQPVPAPVSGWATLVSDPDEALGATRVEVRIGGRRMDAWARGGAAGRLRARLSGERVWLSGHASAVPPHAREFLAPRHIAARLTVDRVGPWSPGSGAAQVANRVRRTLLAGVEPFPAVPHSLFAGFVLGDDRGQPPEVAFDFRESGLAHLLVVSGQNVAFVLALAGPLLRRFGLTGRLTVGVAVLLLFGTLTRWEPSVVRAVAMASVTLLAASLGRPASTVRVLSLAVAGLLLIDPLLVQSVGFQLSVGACAGIGLLSRPLARALPGPRPLIDALSVTIAAQAGVAPVLVTLFGGIPVATLLANLLALPAAGPLTVWGLAAGLPAGLLGGTPARLLHLPTRVLLWWVAAVARWGAALPLGRLRLGHVVVLAIAGSVALLARARAKPAVVKVAAAVAIGALALPVVSAARPGPAEARTLVPGAELWRAGAGVVVILDGARASPDRIISALRRSDVVAIDVLVLSRPGSSEAVIAAMIQRRIPAALVLAPPGSPAEGARVLPADAELRVGSLVVHVVYQDGRLAASVSVVPP